MTLSTASPSRQLCIERITQRESTEAFPLRFVYNRSLTIYLLTENDLCDIILILYTFIAYFKARRCVKCLSLKIFPSPQIMTERKSR